jgi:cation-transporting ATPase 13A3/4/5
LISFSIRFTDLLSESTSILPGSLYQRDLDPDYRIRRAVLYTMATCHSLRVVAGELIGDPLDLKMFQFTGWSYDEGNDTATVLDEEHDYVSPSVARPSPEFDLSNRIYGDNVSRNLDHLFSCSLFLFRRDRLNWVFFDLSNS